MKIFTSPTCPHCQALKKWLKENGIEYEDYNVKDDPEAVEKMRKYTDAMQVPVIVLGKDVIVGFDKDELKEKLK